MKTSAKRLWAAALAALLTGWLVGRTPVPGSTTKRLYPEIQTWPQAGPLQPTSCASRFSRFPRTKPDGLKRIGVFGGSHVVGAEAASGFDFPTLLEGHLRRRGRAVDVLNSGTDGSPCSNPTFSPKR